MPIAPLLSCLLALGLLLCPVPGTQPLAPTVYEEEEKTGCTSIGSVLAVAVGKVRRGGASPAPRPAQGHALASVPGRSAVGRILQAPELDPHVPARTRAARLPRRSLPEPEEPPSRA